MNKEQRLKLLQQGIEMQKKGEFTQAEHAYQTVLNQHPKDPDANNLLGTLAFEAGDYDAAIAFTQTALRSQPKEVIYLNNLANIFIRKDLPQEAIPYLKKALKINSNLPRVNLNLAKAYMRSGAYDEAGEIYDQLMKAHPQHPEALTGKADLHASLGEMDKAAKLYQTVINIDHGFTAAYVGLAAVKKYTEPAPLLNAIEQLVSNEGLPKLERQALLHAAGKICDDLAKYDQAFRYFEAAKSLLGADLTSRPRKISMTGSLKTLAAIFLPQYKHQKIPTRDPPS